MSPALGPDDFAPSLVERSPLPCFDDRRKTFQQNLLRLGPLAVSFPALKRPILWLCRHAPNNRFFLLVNYAMRVAVFKTRITPSRIPWSLQASLFLNGLKNEFRNLHTGPD
jgi:hypothetical protein